MNERHKEQERLAAEIGRELKSLPMLKAPATLLPRVMAAVHSQAAAPAQQSSWESWPAPLRVALLVVLVTCFGGLCLLGSGLRPLEVAGGAGEVRAGFAVLSALWNALSGVAGAVVWILKNLELSTPFVVGCLSALALGYGLCVGVGAIYFKLAMTRRNEG